MRIYNWSAKEGHWDESFPEIKSPAMRRASAAARALANAFPLDTIVGLLFYLDNYLLKIGGKIGLGQPLSH